MYGSRSDWWPFHRSTDLSKNSDTRRWHCLSLFRYFGLLCPTRSLMVDNVSLSLSLSHSFCCYAVNRKRKANVSFSLLSFTFTSITEFSLEDPLMKVYLAAPGQHSWPNLSDDLHDRILQLIKEYFNDETLQRTRKRKKSPSSSHPIKQHLAIGLRAVLRLMKQKRCAFAFVCTSLTPLILSKPMLLLSQMHSIPAIRLKNLSTALTSIFAIPHCSVFALKSSCDENAHLKEFLERLREISLPTSVNETNFTPGKILAPYQNPKRVAAGVQKTKQKQQQQKKKKK